MTPKQFANAVEHALTPLADEAKAEGMKAYLLNQFEFLGLAAPVRRAAVKEIGKVKWHSTADLLAAAELLWQKPEREYRYTAVDLLRQHSDQLSVNDLPALQALLLQDAWWETVDGLSAVIADVMHVAVQQKPNAAITMDVWLKHPSHWVRRSAMLHQLGWRLDTDTTSCLLFTSDAADETVSV
jgi:3-methyladenine DNA glycosylase AlkD